VLFCTYIFSYSHITVDKNNVQNFSKSFVISDNYKDYKICLEEKCLNNDDILKDIEYIDFMV
jgi:hypothetical protein